MTHIDFHPSGDTNVLRWFLVQLRPNGLARAHCNLTRQGFSLFCPMERSTLKRKGHIGPFWRALFPGYLFVGFDPASAPWRKINSTFGVAHLVSFGEAKPEAIPIGMIESLRGRCDANDHMLPPKELKLGDNVRIVSGPFSEFTAKIERITPDQRIWVLLDLLGKKTPISLRCDNLQLI